VRRREVVAGLGAAAAWPLAARAQPTKLPVVGYLSSASPRGFAHFVTAMREGLSEAGLVHARDYVLEYRWAEGEAERLPAMAAELVGQRVAVIVATGGNAPALAAKAATESVPIVFTGGADPVSVGLVASLARPGGNATGVINITPVLNAKRLALLRELAPAAHLTAVLYNRANPGIEEQLREIQEAARASGEVLELLQASSEREIDSAFESMAQRRAGALFICGDPFFTSRRAQLASLAARYGIPASYSFRDFVSAGGLMSYGPNLLDLHRQAGVYVGHILKGAKPAELPVLLPTRFDLVINLKTANALGLDVSSALLARADEVIE
jgi:putative ABC transport system substrate-binding protein